MLNNLLLIDDDDTTHFICENVIKEEEITQNFTGLKNGKQAIDFFRDLLKQNMKAPELILLDINMPVMNGWEFLEAFSEEFKDKFPETRIYMLTSSLDPLDLTHSKNYENVIGYMNKPLIKERVEELKTNDRLAAYF